MMRGASGDECGNLLGQEYNRPAEAGVLKKPREATLTFNFTVYGEVDPLLCMICNASRDLIVYTVTIQPEGGKK
jgi:hypothetical protein